jgi:ribonuclease R
LPKRANRNPSTPDDWRQTILQYIAAHPDRPLRARALGRELGVPPDQSAAFRAVLRELLESGALALGRGRALSIPDGRGTIPGVFRANRRGFGFLEVPGSPDLFVPEHATGDALDGDTVAARVVHARRRGEEPRAEIVRVVQRAAVHYVGVLERHGSSWIVQPQGKAPAPRVTIEDPTAKSARPGDLVVVEPLAHTLGRHGVRGVIVERLGNPDATTAKVLGVIRRFGIPQEFPEGVRVEAQRVAAEFSEDHEVSGREDLRALLTITIDPPDARDFDDAISLEPLDDGRTRLGIHIADVSHFVASRGPLDQEALLRGNSAYFPRYVVPMLPEVLSNGVCSLQPGRTRLTKSVFITYGSNARPIEARYSRSVIRSAMRLTYEEVSAFLESRKPAAPRIHQRPDQKQPIPKEVASLLFASERLARAIRERRIADGMVVLAVPEVEIVLNDNGGVVDAHPADASFSHTIIEMFMVEANEAVSRMLSSRSMNHLRRVHPPPSPESGDRFSRLVASLGRPMRDDLNRSSMRSLLDSVKGEPEEAAVNYLLLRCMAQASYSSAAQGHFALASDHYCHFTSPIRRYPDLVNHRQFDAALNQTAPQKRRHADDGLDDDLAEAARHCNFTERRAQDAEREVTTALLIELMKSKRGEVFGGVITGTSSAGAFVQIAPYMAEGLIARAHLGNDSWEYDGDHSRFIGRRSGRVIHIGQRVRVELDGIDDVRLELSFVPASSIGATPAAAPRRRRGKGKPEIARRGRRSR